MPSLVHQIGELFLRAVPVALIVLVFYFVLRSLFFKPILAVMAERDARTLGAQKSAEAAQAAAAEKVRQYEEALKQAKAKVYAEQEAARKKLLEERTSFLKDARSKAAAEVGRAKERVVGEFEAAKKDIERSVSQLATEIAGRVVEMRPGPGNPSKEAR
jgi:F-type H+-transporting ATPase subunit b